MLSKLCPTKGSFPTEGVTSVANSRIKIRMIGYKQSIILLFVFVTSQIWCQQHKTWIKIAQNKKMKRNRQSFSIASAKKEVPEKNVHMDNKENDSSEFCSVNVRNIINYYISMIFLNSSRTCRYCAHLRSGYTNWQKTVNSMTIPICSVITATVAKRWSDWSIVRSVKCWLMVDDNVEWWTRAAPRQSTS